MSPTASPRVLAARQLAIQLMLRYGLDSWVFGFNRGRRRAGVCFYPGPRMPGRIELSVHFCERNSTDEVRDTILHEIAHALAYAEYGHKGHGYPWKKVCLRIGARPERCYDSNAVDMPKGKWRATCPSCRRQYHRHRRQRSVVGYWCKPCGSVAGALLWSYQGDGTPP